jgi:hypothetical protein
MNARGDARADRYRVDRCPRVPGTASPLSLRELDKHSGGLGERAARAVHATSNYFMTYVDATS